MTKEMPWESWCRLCSIQMDEMDAVLNKQNESSNPEMSELIERCFCIKIIKNVHKTICTECHNFLGKIQEFSKLVMKVNEMFTKLSDGKAVIDPNDLNIREHFGIYINDCLKMDLDRLLNLSFEDISLENNNTPSVDTTASKTVEVELVDNTEDQLQTEISFIKTEIEFDETQYNSIMNTEVDKNISRTNIARKKGTKFYRNKRTSIKENKIKTKEESDNMKQVNAESNFECLNVGEKLFTCEKCSKAFQSNSSLKYHIMKHTNELPFKCSNCDAKFKTKCRLRDHEDKHSGTIYSCTRCNVKLSTKRTLRNHLALHFAERKHKCEVCGISFKKSYNLKYHLILHSGLKLFSCNFCDAKFTRRYSGRLHLKSVHPKEYAELGSDDLCLTRLNEVPTLKQLREFAAKQSLCRNVSM